MAKLIDLTGQTFGRLTVLGLDPVRSPLGQAQWRVRCSCGTSKDFLMIGWTMKSGNTTSCGCLRKENTGKMFRKHGLYGTPEYTAWIEISRRCYNENAPQYHDYGGRGIRMSEEWKNDFNAFLRDMGKKPTKHHTIDRIDNNGNYEKGNCRWADRITQANNTRANVAYDYQGEKLTIAEFSRRFDFHPATMGNRLLYLPVEAAIDKNVKFETYVLNINGKEKPMKDWLRFVGITFKEYVKRRRDGASIEDAIMAEFKPVDPAVAQKHFDSILEMAQDISKKTT